MTKARILFLVVALFCKSIPVSADDFPSGFIYSSDARLGSDKVIALYEDFNKRLEEAFTSSGIDSVAVLYQTNGVSALVIKSEFARWRQVVEKGAKPMPPFLKIFSELSPESRRYWEAYVHRLTQRQVSAIAAIRFQGGFQMTLPLVLVGDRLLVVPSEKIKN
jgi:hypothetical protein